ncbi:MAG: DUF58 domain-containing protein [Bacteroidales bacterium]|nr:DUF58 domain-containing protein [Bacteroidales bacterium]
MDSAELIKKVRKIEIRTKRLSQQLFSGQYHSAFKGRGMAFSEVREYQFGDEVRSIDWNVTARFDHPYVKVFEEERELTVMLLIDVSASNLFGTRKQFKVDLISELAAVLSFSAINNNDKVGVIFFSNEIEKFIPPKKGKSHILCIIRELINYEPMAKQTDIGMALRYLTDAVKKRCTVFLISDFVSHDFGQPLRIAANKHDIVALQIHDAGEEYLPDVGLMQLYDAESEKYCMIDTSSKKVRQHHHDWWQQCRRTNLELFRHAGVDVANLYTDRDYVPALTELFLRRSN